MIMPAFRTPADGAGRRSEVLPRGPDRQRRAAARGHHRHSPDLLRVEPKAVQFVRDFFTSGKPVGAICHGPWLLIEAGVIKGCRATSYHSIKTDMKNAGAKWVDEQVVVDNGLITSRKPDDLKAFSQKLIEEFAEGRHHQRMVA